MLIKDPSIRSHYGQAIKDLRWQLFRAKPAAGGMRVAQRGGSTWGQPWGSKAPQGPSAGAKSSMLAMAGDGRATDHLREAVILAACILCPQAVESFESGLESMSCTGGDHAVLRDLVLRHAGGGAQVLHAEITAALGPNALENLLSQRHVAIMPCIRKPGDAEITTLTIAEELAKLAAVRGLKDEVDDAADDLSGEADEGVTWRLAEAARAADRAQRAGQEDKAEYVIADNGARLDRAEVAKSRSFFDQIDFSKGGKKQH